MAGLFDTVQGYTPSLLQITIALLAILISSLLYLLTPHSLPKNAPPPTQDQYPFIGAYKFFSERADWFLCQRDLSPTGNFSFFIGTKPVIALSGQDGRALFFDSKAMGFVEGYGAMINGAPARDENMHDTQSDANFSNYFKRRVIAMLKGNVLAKNLPVMLKDVRTRFDVLAAQGKGETAPFDSVYRTVFQLTMRTVGCREIAEDEKLRERTLRLYETVENASSPWAIVFPWLPLISKVRRTMAGAELYVIFKGIVDNRKKEGRKEDDALQQLIDDGDDLTQIITFVLGVLFAAQLNSGVMASWLLIHLALNDRIREQVFSEIKSVAERHTSDRSQSLKDQLISVPPEAWENEFPFLDACLRETIRQRLPGAAFRKNVSGQDIPLSTDEIIPKNAYVTYLWDDIHRDESVYPQPNVWDPHRFEGEHVAEKSVVYPALIWGVSRHPCLGMRFAKMENNMIIAFFLAYFDHFEVYGLTGRLEEAPPTDHNLFTTRPPRERYTIKYRLRKG